MLPALAFAALLASAIWWASAIRLFTHPQLEPGLITGTVPMAAALALGILAVVGGVFVAVLRPARRARGVTLGLAGLAATAGPMWAIGETFATMNDWNFANRTFLAAYLPAAALAMSGTVQRVTRIPHFTIHHAHPIPVWEAARLERQWRRLHTLTRDAPRNGIDLYLNDANTDVLGMGKHGAAEGPLVIGRALTLVNPCDGGVLHEIAHAFMYVQSRGNTFPQLLDEGWAVANEGCSARKLDARVLLDIRAGSMPPLEDRLSRAGFQSPAFGGASSGYDAAGSWVGWLLARYGPRRFMALINSSTPGTCVARTAAIYGASFATLEQRWLAYIAREFGLHSLVFSAAGS